MATIKSFTDISQSKTLSKILPLESADMFYCYGMDIKTKEWSYDETPTIEDESYKRDIGDIPCWSLAALLGVLPNKLQIVLAINDFQGDRKEKYVISSVEHDKYDCYADNPVDACYEMIIKLHKHKML